MNQSPVLYPHPIKEFKEREKQEIKKLEQIAQEARAEEEAPSTLKLSDIKKQMDENKASMQKQLAERPN